VNHGSGDAVLDAAAGIEPLELGEEARGAPRKARQLDERRGADGGGHGSRGPGGGFGRELQRPAIEFLDDVTKKKPRLCRGFRRSGTRLSKPAATAAPSSTR